MLYSSKKETIIDIATMLLYFIVLVVISNWISYNLFLKKDINFIKGHNYLMREYIKENSHDNNLVTESTRYMLPAKDLGNFRLTFYTPKELGAKSPSQLRTATGTIPQEGRTIATDPRVIPKNSIVYIEGWGYYIAEDTGSAIKNKKIDIFMEDYATAIKLGNNQQARVYIINQEVR